MRERVDSLGGSLSLVSQPGHTIVTAHVPVGARLPVPETL
jgi:two-component system NarL family sensor kinase